MIKEEEKLLSYRHHLQQRIEQVEEAGFLELALEVFRFQAEHNPLYRQYLQWLGIATQDVRSLEDLPFLPVSAFKHHEMQTLSWTPETVFSSSGTTGMQNSRHPVRSLSWYEANARRCFSAFYGPLEPYCFLALLPSYLERNGSSLVYMAQDFIRLSGHAQSGFFLYDTQALRSVLHHCREQGIPTVLLGVSFALWDFAEEAPLEFPELIVMETGGMKGRREEITREELHGILMHAFGVSAIHSEYGMTELLSQAYSNASGVFHCPPPLRIRIRDTYDPFSPVPEGRTGLINLIDLANLDTVSFIATDDLGRITPDGGFEVLGRLDFSDLRGCNLLLG